MCEWLIPITENRMRGRALCFTAIPNPSFGSAAIAAADATLCMNRRRPGEEGVIVSLADAVQVFVSAQIHLAINQRWRRIETIRELVLGQRFHRRSMFQDDRRPVAGWNIHPSRRAARRREHFRS